MLGISMKGMRSVERYVDGHWELSTVQMLQKGDRIRLTTDTPDSREITVSDNPIIALCGDFMIPMSVTMAIEED